MPRKDGYETVSRIWSVRPSSANRFALRMTLNHKALVSCADGLTTDGVTHGSYTIPAIYLGPYKDKDE